MDYFTSFLVTCQPGAHPHTQENLLPLTMMEKEIFEKMDVDLYQPYPEFERYYICGNELFDCIEFEELSTEAWAYLEKEFPGDFRYDDNMCTMPQLDQFLEKIIQRMADMDDYKDVHYLSYHISYFANKARPGSYGGAVGVISKLGTKFKTTFDIEAEMINETMAELEKTNG